MRKESEIGKGPERGQERTIVRQREREKTERERKKLSFSQPEENRQHACTHLGLALGHSSPSRIFPHKYGGITEERS